MMHAPDCECDAYGCVLRRKGVQLSPGQARSVLKGQAGSNSEYNGVERAIAGERRKGGTFMPYLDKKGNTVPIKQHRANEAHHREIRRRQHDQAVSSGHHH